MASEVLDQLARNYRTVSAQLESAIEQEFPLWSVVKNTETGTLGVFISAGVIKNWLHIRVDGVNQEWKIHETERCDDQSQWPEWIKRAKGVM